MILRRETNIYDDEAIKNSIDSVEKKVTATYGTCSTAASTKAKTVNLDNFTLFKGAQITVHFSNSNSVSAPTLNVNGTGAKPIWARGEVISETYYWSSNSTHHFTYDGSHWVMENAESTEEIYLRLTNNEEIKGIFMDNGQLYINMDYLHTGMLRLGGSGANATNGLMIVQDASGAEIGRWSKDGISITKGTLNIGNGNFVVTTSGAMTAKQATISGELTLTKTYGSTTYHANLGDVYAEIGYVEDAATGGLSPLYKMLYGFHIGSNASNADKTITAGSEYTVWRSSNDRPYRVLKVDYLSKPVKMEEDCDQNNFMWRRYVRQTSEIDSWVEDGYLRFGNKGIRFDGGTSVLAVDQTSMFIKCRDNNYISLQTSTFSAYVTSSVRMILSSSGLYVNGSYLTSSSSKRYKHSISDDINEELDPHKLYNLPMKQFVYNEDFDHLQYADMKGLTIGGFIAEDVAKIYPSAVIHNQNGEIESWDERRVIPAMLKLIQEQHEEIEKLKRVIRVS